MGNYKEKLERMKAIEINSHFTLAKIAEELAQNKERLLLTQNNVDDVTTPAEGQLTVFIDEEGKLSGKTFTGDKISLGGVELSTSLEEVEEGKAADATVIKTLNDSKYPKPQNGSGIFSNILSTAQDLVGMGFSLAYANFTGADLSGANFTGADLTNAYLTNAYLSNAYLSYVNFTGADLSGANLEDVGLYDTKFSSANLSGATGLNANINIALADVNKDPYGDGQSWTLTWTDGNEYSCDPSTGLFTLVV